MTASDRSPGVRRSPWSRCSLAVGIGANTAIFSLVNAVILRDSPLERPEEVVNLYLHQASFEFGTLSLLSLWPGAAGIGLTVWLLDLLATADLRLPVLVTLGLRLDARVLPLTLGVSVWPAPCWA